MRSGTGQRLSRFLRHAPLVIMLGILLAGPRLVDAQKDKPLLLKRDTTYVSADSTYVGSSGGEFTPSKGFDVFKSKYASLNLSVYGLARYINQMPGAQTFTDQLGRPRVADTRHDVQWHRTFFYASGHFLTPKFRYTISLWGLASTGQMLAFGNFQYNFKKALRFGVGVGPNFGARSMQIWPFFHGSDRQMVEEFMRGGFTGSFWVSGEPLPKFNYILAVGNNLSTLGISSANLTREFAKSATIWWMPTTGEFGPRMGNTDFEEHQKLATRFGASFLQNVENRSNQITEPNPLSTQIRMSDGVLLFETSALGDGVTIQEANFLLFAADAGIKYKGLHVQLEGFYRKVSNFKANGPTIYDQLEDLGFNLGVSYPIVSKRLIAYAGTGMVFDEFERRPWEVSGGLNYYPSGTRTWRINAHLIRVEKSPTGGQFGYYIPGQSGTTISLGTDLLL